MVTNEEISKRLELARNGTDSGFVLENLSEIQRPFEWVDGSCIIDFDLWPVENLSITTYTLFEEAGYSLEEGKPIYGIYGTGNPLVRLVIGWFAFRYRFKVEIYSKDGKTYLKIYKAISGILEGIISGWRGFILYNDNFNRIIRVLIYLQPNYEGCMVCSKCGGYYKLQPGEFPNDFDVCQCGGELEYYPSSDPKKIEVKPKSLWDITLLIPIIILLILCGVILWLVLWDTPSNGFYILLSIVLAFFIVAGYTLYYFVKFITRK